MVLLRLKKKGQSLPGVNVILGSAGAAVREARTDKEVVVMAGLWWGILVNLTRVSTLSADHACGAASAKYPSSPSTA